MQVTGLDRKFGRFTRGFAWESRPKMPTKHILDYEFSQRLHTPIRSWVTVMSQQILAEVEKSSLKADVTPFDIGDTVDVHTKILEGNKERIQIFSGVVIARSGSGTREMFVVRRIVAGEGVERKFPVHSPRIEKIEVKRKSVVRRAKLYFLRERSGKAVRLKERRG